MVETMGKSRCGIFPPGNKFGHNTGVTDFNRHFSVFALRRLWSLRLYFSTALLWCTERKIDTRSSSLFGRLSIQLIIDSFCLWISDQASYVGRFFLETYYILNMGSVCSCRVCFLVSTSVGLFLPLDKLPSLHLPHGDTLFFSSNNKSVF